MAQWVYVVNLCISCIKGCILHAHVLLSLRVTLIKAYCERSLAYLSSFFIFITKIF